MSREVMARMSRRVGVPPAWTSVLAVIAHPDDASCGLGAILDAFVFAGAPSSVQAWPWVRQSTETLAPAKTKASRLAPRPYDASSGWASTASTEVHAGGTPARRLI